MADLRASIRVDMVDGASANAKAITAATDRLRQAQLRAAQAARTVAAAELEAAQAAVRDAQGKGDSAEAADRLARAELRAANAARALAQAELTTARASQQSAAAASQAATATGTQMAGAATTAATATRGISDAQKAAGRSYAEGINLVSELALGFGNLSPATRGAALAFAGAGNNAFAMANVMGPLGAGLAVVLGLLPSAIQGLQGMAEGAKNAREEAAKAAEAFNDLVDARLAEQRQHDRQRAIDSGEASSDEIRAAIEVGQEQATAARRRARSVRGSDIVGRGFFGGGAAGATIEALFDEDRRAGLFEQIGGGVRGLFGGEGFVAGARGARADALEEARRAESTARRRRDQSLRVALDREDQEALEERASRGQAAVAPARRALSGRLDELRVSGRVREGIEQAAASGSRVHLNAAVRRLSPEQQEGVRAAVQRVADASALAERARSEADSAPIRALDEARATERARGGDDVGVVTVGRGGGGGAGGEAGAELVLANTQNPFEEVARSMARSAEMGEEQSRRTLEASRILERAAQRRRSLDTGPSATGGGE